MPASVDPYQPPEHREVEASSCAPWKIQDNALWFRNGAYIRGLDLKTGEPVKASPAIRKLKFVPFKASRTALSLLLATLASIGTSYVRDLIDRETVPNAVFFGVWFLILFAGKRFFHLSTWTITYESNPVSLSRRLLPVLGGVGLVVACNGIVIGGLPSVIETVSSKSGSDMVPLAIVGYLTIPVALTAGIYWRFLRDPMQGRKVVGEWMRLEGVSPRAIIHLANHPPSLSEANG